jgi:ribosome-binding ATPase YchF (GTP1/OBG family)
MSLVIKKPKVGIVGKPNVGKSTFFSAATFSQAEIGNFPFTTIEPNKGISYVRVKDPAREFGKVSNPREGFVMGEWRFVPIELIDVAGLVPGAHEGRGLGNQFLDDLREGEGLIHVIDASGSTDEEGRSVPPGSYDPANDIKFLEEELYYWIKGIIEKNWEKMFKLSRQGKNNEEVLAFAISGLGFSPEKIKNLLSKLDLRDKELYKWDEEEKEKLIKEVFKSKPIVIAANKIDIPTAEENIKRLKEQFPNLTIIPTAADAELALRRAHKAGLIYYIPGESKFEILKKLTPEQETALKRIETILEKYGNTGVQQVLDHLIFNELNYIAVFPGGTKKLEDSQGRTLPDCFLMPKGTKVIEFAEAIHSDLAKHFIKAIDVRTKKLLGKDYELKHMDIIEIVAGK